VNFFKNLFQFTIDLGIDLGTANTLIYIQNRGILINEPSMIAFADDHACEIGFKARDMLGKHAGHIEVVRPLRDGVIAEFTAAEEMITRFVQKANVPKILLNHIVCGVPTGITSVEKRAVIDTLERCGARRVSLVAEPMAAAIGVGLDVTKPRASMVVDIGGGTTDIAVIAYSGIVMDNTINIAGDELNNAIIHYVKTKHNVQIGEQSAENLKINFGSALPDRSSETISIKGLDTIYGQPKLLELSALEIYYAMESIIQIIINAVKNTIERTPPELVADIIDYGIVLSGGGALIRGLDKRLMQTFSVPVHIAENPLYGVVHGTQKILDNYALYQHVLLR
jgi:rod shape-determining protein MreB